jgi:putative CocE/NonD family hydrolase
VFGPWTHTTIDEPMLLRETLAWFQAYRRGGPGRSGDEVRLFDTGMGQWIGMPRWVDDPPITTFFAAPDGSLGEAASSEQRAVGWTYDPMDPLPSIGLTAFGDLTVGGPHDNTALLERPDVRSFVSAPLGAAFCAVGRVTADVAARSDAASADFFVRVLDVAPSGTAVNVCEAIRRVDDPALRRSAGAVLHMDLGPIAHTFAAGHAIAVMVSSSAHPMYERNLGRDDPVATATAPFIAHPSIVVGGPHGLTVTFSLAAVHR